MNYLKIKPLSRRVLLKGMGASMALPFLEAMGASTSSTSSSSNAAIGSDGQPLRYGAVFMPNGAMPGSFVPSGSTLDKLPPVLQPLGKMSKKVNVISGLSTGKGGHTASTAGFLTGQAPATKRGDTHLDVLNSSIDQIIAQATSESCPLSSLELGMHTPRKGISPSGLPWIYGNVISWKNATTPIPQEINPMRAFLRMFEHASVTGNVVKKSGSDINPTRNVVDSVLDDAKRLQRKLGKSDSDKLDEYLTNVRDVQERIARQNSLAGGLKVTEEILADIKNTEKRIKKGAVSEKLSALPKIPFPEYMEIMMDIMALAFWSNSTRSCTLMCGDGASRRNMSFIDGVSGDHHGISHHGNKSEKTKQYELIGRFYVKQFAYLLNRLDSMKEGGSSVLENSMIMMGSGIGNGQIHSKGGIPLMLAGSAGGKVKTNRHIKASGSIGQLHRSVLDVMNISDTEIKGKGNLGAI
ncbi:DUF1552 domain-containing protein [Akkermansiaceae bacterium]|nr:DUF1552 domain-containing protein [Akkermansiaceae bacterium]